MKRQPNYKLLIIAPLLAIVVGVITAVLLSKFVPGSPVATVAEPAEIIKQYQASGTVEGLSNLYTKKANPLAGLDTISYTADGSYMVSVQAQDSVQFEQKNTETPANDMSVKTNTQAFLVTQGLQKKSTVSAATSSISEIFDSDKTVCQIIDLPSAGDRAASLTLTCIKKSAINDQYSTINTLLGLYSGAKSDIANPTAVRLTTINEDDKTLSTADVYGLGTDKSAVSLIYGAIGGSQEYIGKRTISNGDVVIDNSVSADLQAKINDPKYDGFLLKHIK